MRVLILFSDTGGGHRAAAVAVRAAIEEEEPAAEVMLRDGLVEGASWPLDRAPAIYSWTMRHAPWAWATIFHLWNGPLRARLMADLGYPAVAHRLKRLLRRWPADVVVSTHPLLTRSVVRALGAFEPRPPFLVVVTDLVSGHRSWYERRADRLCLPTPEAQERFLRGGLDPGRLVLTGQPVHPRCAEARERREELRERFGWDGPVVLLVGGGEGMGRLEEVVRAAAAGSLDARFVVVCGRNARLRRELEETAWSVPVEVHGFVRNLHELMAAADVLVTKGGPGSIMEGAVAGLPMLVYSYLPGQEAGNVLLLEERGAGRYVPAVGELVTTLRSWLSDPAARRTAAEASRRMAVPDSAERIAREVLALAASGPGRG